MPFHLYAVNAGRNVMGTRKVDVLGAIFFIVFLNLQKLHDLAL